jgi:hypothetical protein
MQYFIDMLEGADLDGRAMVVALATDFRNTVLSSREFLQERARGTSSIYLVRVYQDLQKQGLHPLAAAVAVWIHTERATIDLSNVVVARRMWSLLSESFDLVPNAAEAAVMMGGNELDITGYSLIPEGFR